MDERTAELKMEIEERRQVQEAYRFVAEQADLANQSKCEFLTNMSHEIRTPMNGIIGMTDLALGTEMTEEQAEYLDTVKVSAHVLLDIINEILDFSRIEAGNLQLEPIEFDLREIVKSVVKSLELQAKEKGITLAAEMVADVPEIVVGDSGRVRQILNNVIGNAVKFTETGRVDLHTGVESRSPGQVTLHFTVTDTGIGIPEEKQAQIFESFVQADWSTTRLYGGTGLGLAISSQLTQMMGGKIWVESEAGSGSRFHVTAEFGMPAEGENAAGTVGSESQREDRPP